MILRCDPHDSPTFVHGRPSSVEYSILLNKRPFMKDIEIQHQSVQDIHKAIKLKTSVVATSDGVQTTMFLGPSEIVASQKEYADEYYVTVKFDVSEYERSATEKLVYAQLVVHEKDLIDQDKKTFAFEKNLAMRGLPIYVFESNDGEQLFKEEGNSVASAVGNTALGQDGVHLEASGKMTQMSELDQKVYDMTMKDIAVKIECLCVHGTCKKGPSGEYIESSCSGRCLTGWSGPHCDTPDKT